MTCSRCPNQAIGSFMQTPNWIEIWYCSRHFYARKYAEDKEYNAQPFIQELLGETDVQTKLL